MSKMMRGVAEQLNDDLVRHSVSPNKRLHLTKVGGRSFGKWTRNVKCFCRHRDLLSPVFFPIPINGHPQTLPLVRLVPESELAVVGRTVRAALN
jgi:hypothetical protein